MTSLNRATSRRKPCRADRGAPTSSPAPRSQAAHHPICADQGGCSTVASEKKTQDTTPAWLRFVVLIFSNRVRFQRFLVVLLILIGALLLAGWLWGGGIAGLAAAALGLGKWLMALFRR